MSLSGVLNNAVSGLSAAQAQIKATSNNIANVETPGYARVSAGLESRSISGRGAGVDVQGIARVTDDFLVGVGLRATADQGSAAMRAEFLSMVADVLGKPDTPGSLSDRVLALESSLSSAATDPTASLRRSQIVGDLTDLVATINNAANRMIEARAQADRRIASDVARVNELLSSIAGLNEEAARGRQAGDSSGAENKQAALLDELASIMDVKFERNAGGVLAVRTQSGLPLVDAQMAAKLNYSGSGSGEPDAVFESILVTSPSGKSSSPLEPNLQSGHLKGLMDARDKDIPDLLAALGELSGGLAASLNAAHAANVSFPANRVLEGLNSGLLDSDALNFTGSISLAVVDASGALVRRADIAFGPPATMAVNNGAPVTFTNPSTIGGMEAELAAAFAGVASVNFSQGKLSLTATNATHGVALYEPTSSAATRGGRSFGEVFGLNALVELNGPSSYNSGVAASDPHGLAANQTMTFDIRDPKGKSVKEITINTNSLGGTNMSHVLAALNNSATGLGLYAQFSLDSNGQIVQTTAPGATGYEARLVEDRTTRGDTGLSFSEVFGIGPGARSGRATALSVVARVANDPLQLGLGTLDLGDSPAPALGTRVLFEGDATGASKLASALSSQRVFADDGNIAARAASVTGFAAALVGEAGARSNNANELSESAEAIAVEAGTRRASVEGVNLDEELSQLTIFQQAYNANARIIAAVQEMMDALMQVV